MSKLVIESLVFAQRHAQCRAQRNTFRAKKREFLLDAFDDAPEAVASLIAAPALAIPATALAAALTAPPAAEDTTPAAAPKLPPIARLAALPAFPSSELPGNCIVPDKGTDRRRMTARLNLDQLIDSVGQRRDAHCSLAHAVIGGVKK